MAIGTPDLLASAMKWLSWREGLVGRNISHVDVPDFVPSVAKRTFAETISRQNDSPPIAMAVTHGQHLPGNPPRTDDTKLERGEPDLKGNEVDLDRELVNLTEISAQSQLASSVYKKNMQFFKIVLGTNRG